MNVFHWIRYPFLSKIFLPFKVYTRSFIRIRNTANVSLEGRVTLGTPDKKLPVVSRIPVNIFFGENSEIKLGHSISIGPGVNILVKDGGKLQIGNSTYFTSDTHLEVLNSVVVGSDCAISWGVTIIDDDHHQLLDDRKASSDTACKVEIGNKVWIGCNVTILKGTVIGHNCVVGANSLVKGRFPDNCLIAGNPAKVIRENVRWK